ncbi:MAG: hypothetical protein WD845_00590 [Pirellulales bacterium]
MRPIHTPPQLVRHKESSAMPLSKRQWARAVFIGLGALILLV